MAKKLNLKSKFLAHKFAVIFVVVLFIGVVAAAYTSNQPAKVVNESGAIMNYYEAEQPAPAVETELGSFPGPRMYSEQFCYNDVCFEYLREDMKTGSSTFCAFEAPTASSSLVSFIAYFDVASSTGAMTITLGKGTNYTSTSTPLYSNYNLTANAPYTLVFGEATTTAPTNDLQFRETNTENNWVTLGAAATSGNSGSDTTGEAPDGICTAIFRKDN